MSHRNSRVASNGRFRILFVDDDRALRDTLVAAVDPACFHVDVVESVETAKHLTELEGWDLLLCGERGTLDQVRAIGLDRCVRAIALSNEKTLDPAVRARPKDAVELRVFLLDLSYRAHLSAHGSAG